MQLKDLSTSGFRNLAPGRISWRSGVNLVMGDNGQGKTNLLEALTVIGNLRSFRGASWRAMVHHGELESRLAATVQGQRAATGLEQMVALGRPLARRLFLSGQLVPAASYLWVCPVFALAPGDADLITGPPTVRRRFLDRFGFLLDAATLHEVRRYRRALIQRNAALRRGASGTEQGAWERALAGTAARVVQRRLRTAELLRLVFQPLYDPYRPEGFPSVELAYAPEGWLDRDSSLQKLEESYRERYTKTRARDSSAGHTLEGPHRHDLLLHAAGRPAREVLSSGQTKIVATALRLATVTAVEEERGEQFPVVIDDVDAELDGKTLARLSVWLTTGRQVFLSSARPEAINPLFQDRHVVTVRNGVAN